MEDRILAGYRTVDSVAPVQLYAGEKQPVSTQGVAAAGYKFGLLNEQGITSKFPVVAEVGGELVPWNPLADSNTASAFATGTFTFSIAVPTAGETVTIGGQTITFAAAADADTQWEVAIGADLAATAANLAALINLNRNAFGTAFPVTASSAGAVTTVRAPGDAGEAVTLAETGVNIAASGATLTAGADSDATPGGANLPTAILPHALDTTATGYNAIVDTPMFVEGVFNYEALDVPAGTTYAEMRAAFRRSGIVIQKLY